MRPVRLMVLLVYLLLASVVQAQVVEIVVSPGAAAGPGASVAVHDMREGSQTADLRFGVVRVPGGAWQGLATTRIARSATLGLLGAATLEVHGAVRTDANVMVGLAGQGVLGPASVRLGVTAGSSPPEAFAVSGLAPTDDAPRVVGPYLTVAGGARWRIDQTFLLMLDPAFVAGRDGLGARLRGSLRVRRLAGDVDGVLAVHGWLDPRSAAVSGALGLGAVLAPRRAPEWHATAWLGWANGSIFPGGSIRGAGQLAEDVSIAIEAAAEPFRRDVPPYRASVEVRADLGAPEAFVLAEAQAGLGDAAPAASVSTGVRVTLPRR